MRRRRDTELSLGDRDDGLGEQCVGDSESHQGGRFPQPEGQTFETLDQTLSAGNASLCSNREGLDRERQHQRPCRYGNVNVFCGE